MAADYSIPLSFSQQPALLIGMGGTGIKTLKRLKAQLIQKSPEVLSENGGNVMFFALDLEPYRKADHLPLQPGEFKPMAIDVDMDNFVKKQLNSNTPNGIKQIWPTDEDGFHYQLGHHRIVMGAGQNRLVGRTAVFVEANKIYSRINQIITDFFELDDVTDDGGTPPQLHIISSIAGGTGSSMIFDIPYLCRLAAHNQNRHFYIYGHFAMAGAFESILKDPEGRTRTQANTYVALTELDNIYRQFAEEYGTPRWMVNYTSKIGCALDEAAPCPVANERPMEFVYLYHHSNAEGINIQDPGAIYDIIAQAISYAVTGGISSQMCAAADNIVQKIRDLSTSGKAKNYSSIGVSTLELPVELMTQYLGYKWAEKLARLKADHPYQRASDEEQMALWKLMNRKEFEPLQAIALPSCPIWIQNKDSQEWEEIDSDNEIKKKWGKLAEEYGLPGFRPKVRGDITEHITANYGDREVEGTKFLRSLDGEVDKYRKECKSAIKEKIIRVKADLWSRVESLVEYRHLEAVGDVEEQLIRSTDAFSHAVEDLQRAIGRVLNVLGYEQQEWSARESSAEKDAGIETIKQSQFFGKKGQVSGWVEAVRMHATAKANGIRAGILKETLEGLSKYLGEDIGAKVAKADGQITDFVIQAKQKADTVFNEARKEERQKAVSVYLINAESFPEFANAKMAALEKRADDIMKDIQARIEERVKGPDNLIDALNQGREDIVLGADEGDAPGCWEEACIEAAKTELKDLDLKEYIKEEFINKGLKKEFQRLLITLDKKAAPWLTHKPEFTAQNERDELAPLDYILYPNGAEEIQELIEEIRDQFRCQVEITEMPPDLTEGVVRLSMRHGYTLESMPFIDVLKGCETSMQNMDRHVRKKKRRTIFKEYETFTCPLDPAPDPGRERVALKSSDYYEAATLFIRAHYYGTLNRETRLGRTGWKFRIEDPIKGTTDRDIPGDIKVTMEVPKKLQEDILDYELIRELYIASKDDGSAMIKIGAIIREDDELKEALANAEEAFRKETGKTDQQVLEDYFHNKVEELMDAKRKDVTEAEIKFLKAVIGSDLGLG